MLILVVYL